MFKSKKSGAQFGSPRESLSPRLRAAAVNPGLLKVAAPSIPSKFLTPIIDTSRTDLESHRLMSNEFCQISKLVEDPSKVGPGSYETGGNILKPQKGMQWQNPVNQNS